MKIFLGFYFLNLLLILCNRVVVSQRATIVKNSLSHELFDLEIKNNYEEFVDLLKPILIERVPGSPGNARVRDYIIAQMESYDWFVETHKFADNTPHGPKHFANIIATLLLGKNDGIEEHNTVDRVVFACHYDSKFFAEFEFIGATDSAVPCALMLDMAQFLSNSNNEHNVNRNMQFIFFDGEEAFKTWSRTDSIYGSRNYANHLLETYGQKAFDAIDLFVLLDLLGGDSSRFVNFFPFSSGRAFELLQDIEFKLIAKGSLSRNEPYYFTNYNDLRPVFPAVDDDHMPFLQKYVPILHLIPVPFPHQWHKADDDFAHLDFGNIQDLRLILKLFMLDLLNIYSP